MCGADYTGLRFRKSQGSLEEIKKLWFSCQIISLDWNEWKGTLGKF